jgi:hypothetical protein
MLLKQYIEKILLEVLKKDKFDDVISNLNTYSEEFIKYGAIGYNHDFNRSTFLSDLANIAESLGFEELDSGAYRTAFSMPGVDWVLKIAHNNNGVVMNRKEIEIASGDHGLGARDLFVQVYDYDKVLENPSWMIVEKVLVFKHAKNVFSLEQFAKIFPTFWSMLKEDSDFKTKFLFLKFVSLTLNNLNEMLGKLSGRGRNSGLSRKDFYNLMSESFKEVHEYFVDFDKVKWGEDFDKISRACAFSKINDLHTRNIGFSLNREIGPDCIVILDYDIIEDAWFGMGYKAKRDGDAFYRLE